MSKPHVVLFATEDQESSPILQLFARRDIELRSITDVKDALELSDSGFPLDVIVLPPRLKSGKSLMTTCLQLKSENALALTPVVALLSSRDKAVLESLFGAGADCCFQAPYEPDLVHLQISAFARQRQLLDDQLERSQYATVFKGPAATLLNEIPHAIIFFSIEGEVTFANRLACQLAGAAENTDPSQLNFLWSDFSSFILAQKEAPVVTAGSQRLWERRAHTISHRSSSRIEVVSDAFRIMKGKKQIGYLVNFSLASDIARINFSLSSLLHIPPLAFQGFAGCLLMLRKAFPSLPIKMHQRVKEMLRDNEQPAAPVGAIAQAVLETLDLVLTTSAEVKVNLRADKEVRIRFGDLFQLLSLITFHAVLMAGPQGETTITSELSDDEHFLIVVVGAEFQEAFSSHPALAPFLRAMQGHLPAQDEDSEPAEKLSLLECAQEIADIYRLRLEMKEGPTFLKVRLKLPLVNPGA